MGVSWADINGCAELVGVLSLNSPSLGGDVSYEGDYVIDKGMKLKDRPK